MPISTRGRAWHLVTPSIAATLPKFLAKYLALRHRYFRPCLACYRCSTMILIHDRQNLSCKSEKTAVFVLSFAEPRFLYVSLSCHFSLQLCKILVTWFSEHLPNENPQWNPYCSKFKHILTHLHHGFASTDFLVVFNFYSMHFCRVAL